MPYLVQSPHRKAVAKRGGKLKKHGASNATIDLTESLTSIADMAETVKVQNEHTQQWLQSEAAKQEARDKDLAEFRDKQIAQGDSQNRLLEALIAKLI